MQKSHKQLLSMIIPAYKQQKTIVSDVNNLDKVLSQLPLDHEIIVVVDGFLDDTYDLAKNLNIKNLLVTGYEKNMGKGSAVRHGVDKARGDVIGFIDAGLDVNPSTIALMLDLMDWNKADIILGSKLHPESKVKYPIWRKVLSWGYRTLTHLMFGFNVRDTQVGLKIFKKKVAKDVFSRVFVKRFAFDVEVLAVAYKLGYKKIYEAPIILDFKAGSISSSNFWKVIFWMLWDTISVFYRIHVLHSYERK